MILLQQFYCIIFKPIPKGHSNNENWAKCAYCTIIAKKNILTATIWVIMDIKPISNNFAIFFFYKFPVNCIILFFNIYLISILPKNYTIISLYFKIEIKLNHKFPYTYWILCNLTINNFCIKKLINPKKIK